jgi:hypothetical protein
LPLSGETRHVPVARRRPILGLITIA